MSDHVLVTGIHRSGTTFVGEVLARSDGLFYLHEPLNRNWGIEGVEHWFPYVYDEESRYADLIDRFMAGDFRYKRTGGALVEKIAQTGYRHILHMAVCVLSIFLARPLRHAH